MHTSKDTSRCRRIAECWRIHHAQLLRYTSIQILAHFENPLQLSHSGPKKIFKTKLNSTAKITFSFVSLLYFKNKNLYILWNMNEMFMSFMYTVPIRCTRQLHSAESAWIQFLQVYHQMQQPDVQMNLQHLLLLSLFQVVGFRHWLLFHNPPSFLHECFFFEDHLQCSTCAD